MNLSDLGKEVAKYAPLLGAVLPIPGGALIGQAIATAFGGSVNDTNDLIQKISQDPNASIKIKEIEANKQIEIEKLLVEKHRIEIENEVKDRQGAREFSSKDITTARNLTYLLVSGSFILVLSIPFLNPDGNETGLMAALITILVSATKDALRAWFGRSFSKED